MPSNANNNRKKSSSPSASQRQPSSNSITKKDFTAAAARSARSPTNRRTSSPNASQRHRQHSAQSFNKSRNDDMQTSTRTNHHENNNNNNKNNNKPNKIAESDPLDCGCKSCFNSCSNVCCSCCKDDDDDDKKKKNNNKSNRRPSSPSDKNKNKNKSKNSNNEPTNQEEDDVEGEAATDNDNDDNASLPYWYQENERGFPKRVPRGNTEQETSGWYDWFFFTWVNRMMSQASDRENDGEPIFIRDLAQLPEWERPEVTRERFRVEWEEGELKRQLKPDESPDLFAALLHTFRVPLLQGAALRFISDASNFALAFILREFVRYLLNPTEAAGVGWAWLAAMILLNIISPICNNWHLHKTQQVFEQMRGILHVLVFDSALTYPSDHEFSGALTAAHGSDPKTFMELGNLYHYWWAAPVYIVACVIALGFFIGWAGFISFLLLLCTLPVQSFMMKAVYGYRKEMTDRSDKRVGLLNELFQGIRITKFMGWEEDFVHRIADAREHELEAYGKYRFLINIIFALPNTTTFLLYVACFAIASQAFDVPINPINVFPAVTILAQLRLPIMFGSLAIAKLQDAKVSVNRIEKCIIGRSRFDYLERLYDVKQEKNSNTNTNTNNKKNKDDDEDDIFEVAPDSLKQELEELDILKKKENDNTNNTQQDQQEQQQKPDSELYAATMKNITVLSAPDSKEIVARNLSLNIHKGKLTVVLGGTGQGKSVLIKALTAECAVDLENKSRKILLKRSRSSDNALDEAVAHAQEAMAGEKIPTSEEQTQQQQQAPIQTQTQTKDLELEARAAAEKGYLRHYSRAAFVPQEAWIKNASVKENVILSEAFDEARYTKALRISQMFPDLKELPYGDETIVGARGNQLSGGQKQRLQLARAIYSNRDFAIFDDPLSALDPHVAISIVNEVFRGEFKNKTVVLVTHMTQFVSLADRVVIMDKCKIVFDGTVDEFKNAGYDVESFGEHDEAKDGSRHHSLAAIQKTGSNSRHASTFIEEAGSPTSIMFPAGENGDEPLVSNTSFIGGDHHHHHRGSNKNKSPSPQSGNAKKSVAAAAADTTTTNSTVATVQVPEKKGDAAMGGNTLESSEERATGGVDFDTYMYYVRTAGHGYFWIAVALSCLSYASFTVVNLVLAGWTTYPKTGVFSTVKDFTTEDNIRWMGLFTMFGGILLLVRSWFLYKSNVNVARGIHGALVSNMVRAPMSWFDVTPTGRLTNRCLTDCLSVDTVVADNILFVQNTSTMLLGTLALTIISSYYLAIIIPFLVIYFWWTYVRYSTAARGLKRLEGAARSPMMSLMNEVCSGLASIRVYGITDELSKDHLEKTALSQQSLYGVRNAQRWVQARTDVIGGILVAFVGAFGVLARHYPDSAALPLTPALTALALSNALSTTATTSFLTRNISDLEIESSATERCKHYTEKIPQERTLTYDDENDSTKPKSELILRPDPQWPTQNPSVEFHDVKLRYRPGLPLVLKGISVNIKGGNRVGIVGRSGSGKSTFLLSLFGMVPVESGKITIDGRDISTQLSIRDLRSRLTTITQDPLLFSGTIRTNLDPFNEHTDEKLWEILDKLNMRDRLMSSGNDNKKNDNADNNNNKYGNRQDTNDEDEIEELDTPGKEIVETKNDDNNNESGNNNENDDEKQQQQKTHEKRVTIQLPPPEQIPQGLQTIVQEKGQNFSQGERQLLCLARALLKKTKILLLDEASASLSLESDKLIQRVIRTEFTHCTIITIAHRISTIIDSDQIIVLNHGVLQEDGHPAELLKKPDGEFKGMLAKLGKEQFEKLSAIAEGKMSVESIFNMSPEELEKMAIE